MSDLKRCYNCKFWLTKDKGYSNYSVLNTTVHCLKGKFEPHEDSYSWVNGKYDHDTFLKQAEKCDEFKDGDGISLDVDHHSTIEDHKDDSELYNAAVEYFK